MSSPTEIALGAANIEGEWKGDSNGFSATLDLTAEKKATGSLSFIGTMSTPGNPRSEQIKGTLDPKNQEFMFDRTSEGTVCEQYTGRITKNGGSILMNGGFKVVAGCGGPRWEEPYPFSFKKQ